jgi:hypothetical protein
MVKKISKRIDKISSGKMVVISLVVFMVFTAVVLPWQSAKAEEFAGDAGGIDTSFFYTSEELYDTVRAYGEAGRQEYIKARWTFDLIWPVVYTFFLATATAFIFRRCCEPDNWTKWLNLVPVAGMIFDYLENLAVTLVMILFPKEFLGLGWVASVFTLVKWGLVISSFILLLGGLVLWGFKSLQRKEGV